MVDNTIDTVDVTHKEYDANLARWKKCRDVIAGEDAVKDAGVVYLPSLHDQSTTDYSAYNLRAMFFPGTSRTLQALMGSLFRKNPTIETPEKIKEELKTIGKDNKSFDNLVKEVGNEILEVGRLGILLDADKENLLGGEEGVASKIPFLVTYTAENIVNWKTTTNAEGKEVLTLVVLKETRLKNKNAVFSHETVEIRRVLKLENNIYSQQVWVKTEGNKTVTTQSEYVAESEYFPKVRGVSLTYIPFIFIGPNSIDASVQKPPLLDSAGVNISMYRNSADLEHGRHFTGLPTPVVAGFDVKQEWRIGSTVAWASEDPSAHAEYLEFTGQGLTTLENAIEEKKEALAVLGARMLQSEKPAPEAEGTWEIKRAAESNIMMNISLTIDSALTIVVNWIQEWLLASTGDSIVVLNKDFLNRKISPELVTQLMQAVITGQMSWETLYHNLQQGELYPDNWTMEDELAAIELRNTSNDSTGEIE